MTARPAPLSHGLARQLRVVPGGAARNWRVAPWVLFTVAVLAAFFGLIMSRTALDRSAFDLSELQQEIALEQARYQSLRLEVAELQSPDRVLAMAEDMGMVFPSEVKTVTATGVVVAEEQSDRRWADLKAALGALP